MRETTCNRALIVQEGWVIPSNRGRRMKAPKFFPQFARRRCHEQEVIGNEFCENAF